MDIFEAGAEGEFLEVLHALEVLPDESNVEVFAVVLVPELFHVLHTEKGDVLPDGYIRWQGAMDDFNLLGIADGKLGQLAKVVPVVALDLGVLARFDFHRNFRISHGTLNLEIGADVHAAALTDGRHFGTLEVLLGPRPSAAESSRARLLPDYIVVVLRK